MRPIQVLLLGFDQVPIDDILAEERIDMFIMRFARGTVEFHVFPVADAWHEFDSQKKGQPKNRQVLSLGIGVDGGWLDAGTVPYQCIEKINSFDSVGLARLLGHASLDTTGIYVQPTEEQLAQAVEELDLNAYG